MRTLFASALLLLGTTLAAHALPHKLGQSYVYLQLYGDGFTGRVEISVGDLNRVLGTQFATDGTATMAEVRAEEGRIRAYVAEHLSMWADEAPLTLRYTNLRLLDTKPQYLLLDFSPEHLEALPAEISAAFTPIFEVDASHRNFLLVEHNWHTGTFNNESTFSLIFSPSSPRQTLDVGNQSVLSGLLAFIKLGMQHIWEGIDHILFLLALLLPAVLQRREQRWEPVPEFRTALWQIVKIVTFFTIAHSITLSLAALEVVRMPSRLVESVIAASIAVAALHNVFPILQGRDWLIAFVFGLFHGFGFATILSELGLQKNQMLLSLLGFNVGVEIGQVALICVLFPVLFLLRRRSFYPRLVLRLGSVVLTLIAVYWLIERAFDVDLVLFQAINPVLQSIRAAAF